MDGDASGLDRLCRQYLGAAVADVTFRGGHLGVVVGLSLADGRTVVVKQRQPDRRLAACVDAQSALATNGFACPVPILGPTDWFGAVVTAEEFVSGGTALPSTGRDPAPFARALARMVALAPAVDAERLMPPPPWNGGDPLRSTLWPAPDDIDGDLNSIAGPTWLDEAASATWERLCACDDLPVAVGHGDWHVDNLRWAGTELHVAYDWDSVIAAPEADIAGFAAAVYPTTGPGTEATPAETVAFLRAYEDGRGRPLSRAERERFWAAGLWVRSFDAKKQVLRQEPVRTLTRAEASERRAHVAR